MKTRDLLLLVGGIVLGALIGAFAIISTRPDQSAEIASLKAQVSELQAQVATAPTPTFRTVNEAAATSNFYLASFETTAKWLEEKLALELTDEQKAALEAIASDVTDEIALQKAFADKKSPVFTTLQFIYDTLVEKRGADSQAPIAACLAIENDFYTGTVQYLYIQLPSAVPDKQFGIPTDWKLLDSPLPNTQTWYSECFKPDTERADGN